MNVTFDASMRVVVLRGPDRYLHTAHTQRLVEALEAEHGTIEQFTYDGESAAPATILDELRSYGLLQAHKLVIVDRADRLFAPRAEEGAGRATAKGRGRGAPKTARELFERYAEQPVDSATLLLRAETWRPGRLDKAVARSGAIVRCDTPGPAAAAGWCVRRCAKAHGCTIGPEAAGLLVSRLGPQLARLDTELAKLAAFVGEGGEIGASEIRALAGLSREEEAWVIQSALLSGSPAEGVAKLRELVTISRQPEQLLAWAMTDLVRKLHGAARLHRGGAAAGTIARELNIWGDARGEILDAARRLEPGVLAQLLRRTVEADLAGKTGLGRPARTLEALAVEIADTLRCA